MKKDYNEMLGKTSDSYITEMDAQVYTNESAIHMSIINGSEDVFKQKERYDKREITLPTGDGTFVVTLNEDSDYPGIDVEFIPKDDVDTEKTRPRVLFENPKDGRLQAMVWNDPMSEDYTEKVIFPSYGKSCIPERFGMLYMGNEPVKIPDRPVEYGDIRRYDGSPVTIMEAADGNRITWLQVGELLIADRCLLNDISWGHLTKLGLVKGEKVTINGKKFLFRIPTDNEWDMFVNAYGDVNDILHWKNIFTWCVNDKGYLSFRGFHSALTCATYDETYYGVYIGFRPVLEPLED